MEPQLRNYKDVVNNNHNHARTCETTHAVTEIPRSTDLGTVLHSQNQATIIIASIQQDRHSWTNYVMTGPTLRPNCIP